MKLTLKRFTGTQQVSVQQNGQPPQSLQQKIDNIEKKTDVGFTNLGRAGLVAAGGLGLGAAYNVGSGIYNVKKLVPDIKNVGKSIANDSVLSGQIKNGLKAGASFLPGSSSGIATSIIENGADKAKYIYDNTKFSKIQKLKRLFKIGDAASRMNRTVLKNAEGYTNMLTDSLVNKSPIPLNDAQKGILKKTGSIAGGLGKATMKFQNSRYLGKAALAVGGISGAAYLHGRELQSYRQMANNNNTSSNQ